MSKRKLMIAMGVTLTAVSMAMGACSGKNIDNDNSKYKEYAYSQMADQKSVATGTEKPENTQYATTKPAGTATATTDTTAKPTDNETATPTVVATVKPTLKPTANTSSKQTKAPTAKATVKPVSGTTDGVTNTQINEYLSKSVFIGDSVMYGFQLYCMRGGEGFLGEPTFLAAGCFGSKNALMPVTSSSVHPIYKGQRRYVWDSVSMIEPEHVFFFFGLNDLSYGLDSAYESYIEVVENVKKVDADMDIIFVSTTPMYAGSELTKLNNANINALNEKLKAYAKDNGDYFWDIASFLKDSNGCLDAKYSGDNYVHENNAAYKVWEEQLKIFVAERIREAVASDEAAKATQTATKKATASPTKTPTKKATASPTKTPTKKATASPTKTPTKKATASPTKTPTKKATAKPTQVVTEKVTVNPTQTPTNKPTVNPTQTPTQQVTEKSIETQSL